MMGVDPLSCLEHALQTLVSNDILDAKYQDTYLIFCNQDVVTDQHLQCMLQATQRIACRHTVLLHHLGGRCSNFCTPLIYLARCGHNL